MIFFAMPDVPPVPVIETMQVAKAPSATASSSVKKMTYGVCELFYATEDDRHEISDSSVNSLDPTSYMNKFLPPELQDALGANSASVDWQWYGKWTNSFKITLLRAPQHGKFMNMQNDPYSQYLPDKGYYGKDRVDLLVEGKDDLGRLIAMTLRYYINVIPEKELYKIAGSSKGKFYKYVQQYCGANTKIWRISENDTVEPLYALLTGAKDVFTGFADLSGSALGSTTGNKITLDTNAAGYGWFIDATPYQNEEWLPTSNPNEWVAKPGSEAEGKMDLLSVLLHEYGHVLGIEHTADRHDLMASILQPGVRHLPDVDAWAALLDKSDNGIAFAQGSTPILAAYSPNTPEDDNPPGAPIPMTVGLTAAYLANRKKGRRYRLLRQ